MLDRLLLFLSYNLELRHHFLGVVELLPHGGFLLSENLLLLKQLLLHYLVYLQRSIFLL